MLHFWRGACQGMEQMYKLGFTIRDIQNALSYGSLGLKPNVLVVYKTGKEASYACIESEN